ncbi:MAG: YegP family protein [Kangiella sp.]|nr:YegP family protein [Kangiella sp.]
MKGKYEIFQSSANNQYYFRLKASNGEIILASEGYTTKSSCQGGIESVRTHSPDEDNYVRKDSTDGQYYFVLRAKNYEIIGRSEMYTTKASRDNGIESVKRFGPDADVVDLT